MKKIIQKSLVILGVSCLVLVTPVTAEAHGGHHSNGHHSASSYYYCNGTAAHSHNSGVCPYASTTSTCSLSKKQLKKVQKALNKLGYHCGKADGIMGSKTAAAISQYQAENSLTVNGCVGDTEYSMLCH